MAQTIVRQARPADHDEIGVILRAAFDGPDEASLVLRLRADGDALIELVAEEGDGLIGHILFSPLSIEQPAGPLRAAAMAPVAVAPPRQRSGVGGLLIRRGIDECKTLGLAAVLVLGHRKYYPRFGFSAKDAESLEGPFQGPSFMALELEHGALCAGGRVRYAAAFGV
jgi:putative acetyltransferase